MQGEVSETEAVELQLVVRLEPDPDLLSLTAWAPVTPQVAGTLLTMGLVTILMAATQTRPGASPTLGVRSSFDIVGELSS